MGLWELREYWGYWYHRGYKKRGKTHWIKDVSREWNSQSLKVSLDSRKEFQHLHSEISKAKHVWIMT